MFLSNTSVDAVAATAAAAAAAAAAGRQGRARTIARCVELSLERGHRRGLHALPGPLGCAQA